MRYLLALFILVHISLAAHAQTPEDVDFNGNQAVDFPDFIKFVTAYNTDHPKYDIDNNGTVDFPDFLAFATHFGSPAELRTIEIPDVLLDNYIRALIKNPSRVSLRTPYVRTETEPILLQDARELRVLSITIGLGDYTVNLQGLEHLTSLWLVKLPYFNITDISPLSTLSNLTILDLRENKISDVSPLRNLTKLNALHLENNQISDVSPLASLHQLGTLRLEHNQIEDISALASLNTLHRLEVGFNQITDISPLTTLPNLQTLRLDGNQITDITALASNAGFGAGDHISLFENPLNDMSQTVHLSDLANRDVIIAPQLRPDNLQGIYFPDPILEAEVRKKIGKPEGNILPADVANIETLTYDNGGAPMLINLEGIEHFGALKTISLNNNGVRDLTPLANISSLEELGLSGNRVNDLSPLANLTQLQKLYLHNNEISDLKPLSQLTNVWDLALEKNTFSDLTPLSNLTEIRRLNLADTPVQDLTPILNLPFLNNLTLRNTMVTETVINTQIPSLESRGVRVYGLETEN